MKATIEITPFNDEGFIVLISINDHGDKSRYCKDMNAVLRFIKENL